MKQERYRAAKKVPINRVGDEAVIEATVGRIIADIKANEYIIMGAYHYVEEVPELDENGDPVLDEDDNPVMTEVLHPWDKIRFVLPASVVDQLLEQYKDVLTTTGHLERVAELAELAAPALLAESNSVWATTWVKQNQE